MLTLPEFVAFLNHLRNSANPEHQTIYNDITEVRDPWRAEWLDAYFEQKQNDLYILTNNKTSSEKLTNHLDQTKTPGINLEYWLNNLSHQGLPKSDNQDGNLYFYPPVAGKVARFGAYSDGVSLDCIGDPSFRNSSLGVRRVLGVGGGQ